MKNSDCQSDLQLVKLLPTDYPAWDALVVKSPHGRLFHLSWWLEATGRPFEIFAISKRDEQLLAGLAIPYDLKYGVKIGHAPPFTPYLGPVVDVDTSSPWRGKVLGTIRRVSEQLAAQLVRYDSFAQSVGPQGPDLQGVLWADCGVHVGYTFQIPGKQSADEVFANMEGKHRREITKAERRGETVVQTDDIETLLMLIGKTYHRQQRTLPTGQTQIIRRLWKEASCRQMARIYVAHNETGQAAAGAATFWDQHFTYLLLAGGDPQLRANGGGNLCIWKAINDSLTAGRTFDFEGSALRGVESHYRGWGAIAEPVFHITKRSTKGQLATLLRNMASRLRSNQRAA